MAFAQNSVCFGPENTRKGAVSSTARLGYITLHSCLHHYIKNHLTLKKDFCDFLEHLLLLRVVALFPCCCCFCCCCAYTMTFFYCCFKRCCCCADCFSNSRACSRCDSVGRKISLQSFICLRCAIQSRHNVSVPWIPSNNPNNP